MTEEKHDISNLEDIRLLVDTFYGKVRNDELIGPIFNERIQDRWPQHLNKMYSFWQTVLLGEHTYFGTPFPPHAQLPVEGEHFERWLSLFAQTVSELFNGKVADEALWRGNKMAEMFQTKIEYYKKNRRNSLIN